jgi:hypothetical protein
MNNFIEEQQREAHMAGLAKSKNAKDCGDLTVLPLGYVSGITKQTITNTLNHILESGLLEGIEGMKPHVRNVPPSDKQSIEAVCLVQVGYEQCKKDILENVVKPLYGKE